jgi:hypothetical protein
LRRMLRLAAEWGLCDAAPMIRMLPGERHREHVVTIEEEARYLTAAPELVAEVAAISRIPVPDPRSASGCVGNR